MTAAGRPPSGGFGRPRRLAADPPSTALPDSQPFQPLPPPTGAYPFHLALSSVLGQEATDAIQARGALDFHMMGDTGGIGNPVPQENVAVGLEGDLAASGADAFAPSFLYLLGDCVYYNGQPIDYYAQFYDPYTHYVAPIMGIPGNHDGDPIDPTQSTLDGFLANFCTPSPQVNPMSKDSGRMTMTQPNVYWTLDAPFVTIVGLYTNVPEHGRLDATQIAWLQHELVTAPADKALLLTMHHPPVSADSHHGSSAYLYGLLDAAIEKAARAPSMVLAGHVHNYQRFTRATTVGSRRVQVPYVVAGAGGYHNLHTMATDARAATLPWPMPNYPGVTLETFQDAHYGFARLRVDASSIRLEYVNVAPEPGVATSAVAPTVVDSMTLDLPTSTVRT